MGLSSEISKLCWAWLLLTHVLHSVSILYDTKKFFHFSWGQDLEEYAGPGLSVPFLTYLARQASLNELLLAYVGFTLGDSKFCYMVLLLANLTSTIGLFRGEEVMIASKMMSEQHAMGMDIGKKVLLGSTFLCIVGFLCSEKKNNRKIQRSPSLIASVILKSVAGLETISSVLCMLDSTRYFNMLVKGYNWVGSLTPVGKGIMIALASDGASIHLALSLAIAVLKPTRLACTIAAILQLGSIVLLILAVQKGLLDQSDRFTDLSDKIDFALSYHTANSLVLIFAATVAVSPEPGALSDDEDDVKKTN